MTDSQSVTDKAADTAQAGKEAAGELASTAADKAKHVASEAKDQAGNVLGEARDQLRGHANDQQTNAVTNLRALGDELRSMATNSRTGDQPSGTATHLVDQAADRAHGAADWLDGRSPEELLDEVRRFARRRPGIFLVGAVAAGVVAGRLTRGVIAQHSDDDSSPAPSALAADTSPVVAPPYNPPVGTPPHNAPVGVPPHNADVLPGTLR